ncbi:hypothetical protein LL946_18840 [Knoellia locipacati]|uniref:hypothetical protein n=1 Tax=Knoellia locipacati TaxID=882824 RepID=UPI00384FA03E
MTTLHIDAGWIAQLGVSLADVSAQLADAGDGDLDTAAFGPGEASGAFAHLMEGWRRQRLALVEQLTDLSDKASIAGGAYVETEARVGRSLGGGPR